ncbi:hypothetical protein YC2023_069767 [Brassica napus]
MIQVAFGWPHNSKGKRLQGTIHFCNMLLAVLRILSVSCKLQCISNRKSSGNNQSQCGNESSEKVNDTRVLVTRCSPHSSDVEKPLYSPERELGLSTFPIDELRRIHRETPSLTSSLSLTISLSLSRALSLPSTSSFSAHRSVTNLDVVTVSSPSREDDDDLIQLRKNIFSLSG